jgi:GNAT superfamily N-acetyltransferase
MMALPALPHGYHTRPATEADAEPVLALQQDISLAMVGEIEETMEDVLHAWQEPGFDMQQQTQVVIHPDGRMIGYGTVDFFRPVAPVLDLYLHTSEQTHDTWTMPYLFAWAEETARDSLHKVPAEVRVVLHAYTHAKDTFYSGEIRKAGLDLVRHSFRMDIHFDNDTAPTAPRWPEGFHLKVITDQADWAAVYAVYRDGWRDHFGYVERPADEHYPMWAYHWEKEFVPGTWYSAMEGDKMVGICLCEPTRNDDESFGWVSTLTVRRAYRRKGLAMALLQTAFYDLYEKGRRRIGLGVDAMSLTGATRLYEQAGMRVDTQFDLYEKELRPGVDTVTREAGI